MRLLYLSLIPFAFNALLFKIIFSVIPDVNSRLCEANSVNATSYLPENREINRSINTSQAVIESNSTMSTVVAIPIPERNSTANYRELVFFHRLR